MTSKRLSRLTVNAIFVAIAFGILSLSVVATKIGLKKFVSFRTTIDTTRTLTVENNLLIKGFVEYTANPDVIDSGGCSTSIFVGHTYGLNENINPKKREYPNPNRPFSILLDEASRLGSARLVFGGDSIVASAAGENFLSTLASADNNRRFVLGNEDDYWTYWVDRPDGFQSIFRRRYWHEDVDGVRFIYLHTERDKDQKGIDDEQLDFLRTALASGAEYRYALIFMHHALFLGPNRVSNESYPVEVRQFWDQTVTPLLHPGRVKAVFAGDMGQRSEGIEFNKGGTSYYLSGWPRRSSYILPEWLVLHLSMDGPKVSRVRTFDQRLFVRLEDDVECTG